MKKLSEYIYEKAEKIRQDRSFSKADALLLLTESLLKEQQMSSEEMNAPTKENGNENYK